MARLSLLLLVLLTLLVPSSNAQSAPILIYDENSINSRAQAAATSLGLTFTVGNVSDFNTLLTTGTWDLVVVDAPSSFPSLVPLINYINNGGAVIMSFWNLNNEPALATAFDVSVSSSISTPQTVYRWDTTHPIFNSPNLLGDLASFSDLWGDNGDRLTVLGGGMGIAGFTASPTVGQAAIVIGNNGRTIYNGFLFDDLNNPAGTELIENQIQFILAQEVPEPASLAAFAIAGAVGACSYLRRRKTFKLAD